MISKKIFFLILLVFTCSFSDAQTAKEKTAENKYRTVGWTIYDGLSQGFVNALLKDKNGFLWIGTLNGLNRFDGNLFKNYYHDPHNNKTIAGNFITALKEDSLHNIWIGTGAGLSRYDIKADTFKNFLPAQKYDPDAAVFPFWATKDKLYAFEKNRIIVYDIHSFKKTILVNLKQTDSLSGGLEYSFFDPGSNSVWMLHGISGAPGGGLINISLKDGKRRTYSWQCYRNIPNHSHYSEEMRYDSRRKAIWINSYDGLIEFTLANKQFHHINGTGDLVQSKTQVGIDIDTRGRIWWANYPSIGIQIYDPSNGSVTTPFPGDVVAQQAVSEFSKTIYCDRDGMTWCGTWAGSGLHQLIPFSPTVKLYSPDAKQGFGMGSNAVINIAKAGDGILWVGTFNGLYEFKTKTGELKILDIKKFPGLNGNGGISVDYTDPGLNKGFISTHDRNFQVDIKTQKCRPVIFKDITGKTINVTRFTFSFSFRNGVIMIGTFKDREYLFNYNYATATANEALSFPHNNNVDDIWSATDHHQLLFIRRDDGVGNLTFNYSNGKWALVPHKMNSLLWTSIFFNQKDSTYWVAAETKLYHYDNKFKALRTYTRADGLPDIGIAGLIADNNGNIWFHTDRSILQLNISTGEISTLAEKDGFEKQAFNLIKYNFKDDNGDIYFPSGGAGKGFDRITPGKYTNRPSSIYLQSLEVNQKPIPLTTGINSVDKLSLSYNQDNITIETGIIDFYSKGASHMRYKLEQKGKNESWQYGPANYTIRFEGLQPGKYTLRMQASNAALQFNGPEKVLNIIISPPWWQTWWAWLVYAVLFVSAVYAFIAYRSRTLTREKHVLEKNVTERTKQLREANKELKEQQEEITSQRDQLSDTITDLKATQKQLIQSEKMASLGELTAGIAHEIQNPLNFVNNFSDVNAEMIIELEGELKTGNIDEALIIAADIRENEMKINHHGKRADSIVKGMLLHSRGSSGDRQLTNINDLCDEYIHLAYHGLRAKDKTFNAEMITKLDNKLPKVKVVPQDIGRVILNLFNNAFYAVNKKLQTEKEGYRPQVQVTTATENNQIIIKVRDNGNGIPDAIKDKIMQPFFTTKPAGEGTGLGLSLTYDMVVKGHGGSIAVETREGEFTEFTVSLPL